nr:unnamed protein product [Callosobruchus analis]
MQLWKTVYINTSYILNFILFENNHHLKSIDVQNTSSPLFTTCILHVTVCSCGKTYTLTLVTSEL